MTTENDVTKEPEILRDKRWLHPHFAAKLNLLAVTMEDIILLDPSGREYRFELFETVRSPERQDHVLRKGASKAGAWQSAHQYGLAADFAGRFMSNQKWTWADHLDWKRLKIEAKRLGLDIPIAWDRGHVESLTWAKVRKYLL